MYFNVLNLRFDKQHVHEIRNKIAITTRNNKDTIIPITWTNNMGYHLTIQIKCNSNSHVIQIPIYRNTVTGG